VRILEALGQMLGEHLGLSKLPASHHECVFCGESPAVMIAAGLLGDRVLMVCEPECEATSAFWVYVSIRQAPDLPCLGAAT
jgi:hypothetical protein